METLTKEVVPTGSSGYINNFLSTLPLLESFRNDDINLTGTVCEDKVKDVFLSNIKKSERGTAELFADKDKYIVVCQWNDNSDVKVATNKTDNASLGMSKCKRWSKAKKERVSVPQPVIIQHYNKGMGGVDLFDQFRGKYRVTFRKRAWYYPLFRFLLNASVVNGWLMYRNINKINDGFPEGNSECSSQASRKP